MGHTIQLVLEDGTTWTGEGFGATKNVTGEVVFNTAMTGYVETLTDPSYRGQILLLTYPLAGNYGVPSPRAKTLAPPYESDRIQPQALVVQNYVQAHSHHAATRSLGDWLKADQVPALTGVDTRSLTRRLREHGTMRGWLLCEDDSNSIDMSTDVFNLVCGSAPVVYPGSGPKITVIDVGAKDNIIRSLLERGASVTRVPWHQSLEPHLVECDGVVIGNGPGDPKQLGALLTQLRALLDQFRKPIFGICLGNQLLNLAAGGDTYKLPYGHRSVNQPVQDLLTRRCFITSQNHGYAVDEDSLPHEWEPWFVNLNDGTNEGIRSLNRPHFSVQFHPEACPGPEDTEFLFDDFMRLVGAMRSQ